MTTTTTTKPASQKQLDLISNLMGEKMFDDAATQRFNDEFSDYQNNVKVASKFIGFMFKLPRKDGKGTSRFNPDAGMYQMGDELYRVKISRTGNWYAELAVKPIPGSGRKSLTWDYIGKGINLSTAQQLSDAEAGKFVGYCVRCNAELTVKASIERGMGPVCANKV